MTDIEQGHAPYGRGSCEVESLTSLVRRLAQNEVRGVAELLRTHVTRPHQQERAGRHPIFAPTRVTEAINGDSAATRLIVSRLTLAFGADLAGTTLLDCTSAVEYREAFRSTRAWCPECLAEPTERAYDRLTWSFSASLACVRHRVALVQRCGHCQNTHKPWHALSTPWSCPHCGQSLAASASGFASGVDVDDSDRIAALVERIQRGWAPQRSEVTAQFASLADRVGGQERLATMIGMSPSGMSTICTGRSRPHFSMLLRAIAVQDALDGTPRVSGGRTWTRRARPPPRPSRRQTLEPDLRRALLSAAPVPSLRAFARSKHVDTATVRLRFPVLAARLVRRRQSQQNRQRRRAEASVVARVDAAVASLVKAGRPPSRRAVEAAVGQSGLLRAPEAQRAYRAALKNRL